MSKSDQRGRKRAAKREALAQSSSQSVSTLEEKSPREEKKKNLVSAKKEPERRAQEEGAVFKYVRIALQFLREAKMELKKVKWPTRKELLASTAVVIALVLLVSLYLGVIDFGLIKIIKAIVG
ncbi:MAG: preprotein translocase subunit SecE [Desulfatiglandales bacterium]|jgi:preprotein translocase subunit SecE